MMSTYLEKLIWGKMADIPPVTRRRLKRNKRKFAKAVKELNKETKKIVC